MNKLRPENTIQALATFAGLMGLAAGGAYAIHPDVGFTGGGVALGMWLSALYCYVNDPDTILL